MLVFIGWSGDSHEVGKVLYEWLPKVNPSLRAYISDEISPGDVWPSTLKRKLEESDCAILCLTNASLPAPWIFLEAGAFWMKNKPIIPFLLDVNPSESESLGPLSYFQSVSFNKNDLKKLVCTLNETCGDNRLTEEALNEKFEELYPELDETLRALIPSTPRHYAGHGLYLESVE